jgi:hypothetical protein
LNVSLLPNALFVTLLLHKTSRIKFTFAHSTLPYTNDYLSKQLLFRNNEVKKNEDYLNKSVLSPYISPMFVFVLLLVYLLILLPCMFVRFFCLFELYFLALQLKNTFLRFRCQLERHNSFHSTFDCYYLFSFLIIIFEKANVTLVSIKHKL